ncbi:MAG: RNA polymerase sigma factor [bacterium]|nr:RNA polymerase sigma factor [bacterium]
MERSNAELLLAVHDGDRRAFEEIYHRNKRRLYGYCLRMLGDSDTAEDVVQHVFLTLLQRQQQIREPESLAGWLLTVAGHRCHRILEERGRVAPLESERNDIQLADPENQSPEIGSNLARVVEGGLRRLSPEMREVIILREYQDMSYRSISEVTGVSEATVRFRLHQARKKLCELLRSDMRKEERHEVR